MKRAVLRFLGFTITIDWEGVQFEHFAWTLTGALSWARCYPKGARVTVSEANRVVAIRTA